MFVYISSCLLALLGCTSASSSGGSISKQGMDVTWDYVGDRIHIQMSAPTKGWVTLGINEGQEMTGAYLLMGRVIDGQAELVEHYTSAPGTYRPVTEHGLQPAVEDLAGSEEGGHTYLSFSLPLAFDDDLRRSLAPSQTYTAILAYSRHDDFQHHSIMRTQEEVEL